MASRDFVPFRTICLDILYTITWEIEARTPGFAVIHAAAHCASPMMLHGLLQRGYDANARTAAGATPLDYLYGSMFLALRRGAADPAIFERFQRCLDVLVYAGAVVSYENLHRFEAMSGGRVVFRTP
jgi:hypothetical protein